MTLPHIGWTAIRRLTAGGVLANRTTQSDAFATPTPVSRTDRAGIGTATRVKRSPVSTQHNRRCFFAHNVSFSFWLWQLTIG